MQRLVPILAAAIAAAAALPVLLPAHLPLHDYPSHIMRLFILAQWEAVPAHHANYLRNTFLLPNVGMDVLVLALHRLMPVEMAGKLAVWLALALAMTGTVALHRALSGGFGAAPLLAGLFLVNGFVMWGFTNYVLGLGLLLWSLALWVALRRAPAVHALGPLLATALYFTHLVAFGIYALWVFGFELRRLLRRENSPAGFVLAGLQFAPAIAVHLWRAATAGEAGFDARGFFLLGPKLVSLVKAVTTYDLALDLMLALPLLALLGLLLAGRLRLRILRPAILPFALVALAFLLLPFSFNGAHFVDQRIPLALVFLGLASIGLAAATPRGERRLAIAIAVLALLKTAAVTLTWLAHDRVIARFDRSLFRPGDIVFSLEAELPPGLLRHLPTWQPPLTHVASYAAVQGAFPALLFSDPTQQPLVAQPALREVQALQAGFPRPVRDIADVARWGARLRALHPDRRLVLAVIGCARLAGRQAPGLVLLGAAEAPICLFEAR